MKEEVWSDLKNNTKKKAARINKAACGTGKEAALNLQLTDLEQWNISLTGVRDAGFSENQIDSSNRTVTLSPTPPVPAASHVVTEESEVVEESTITNLLDFDAWTETGPNHITSPLPQPSSSTNTHHEEVKVVLDSPSPAICGTWNYFISNNICTTLGYQTTYQIECATGQFLNCDEQWRSFLEKKICR